MVHPNPPDQSVVKQDSEPTATMSDTQAHSPGEAAHVCRERGQALRALPMERSPPHQSPHHTRSARVPELSPPKGPFPQEPTLRQKEAVSALEPSLPCFLIPTGSPHTGRNYIEIPVLKGEKSCKPCVIIIIVTSFPQVFTWENRQASSYNAHNVP